jgi:hypothetical protein
MPAMNSSVDKDSRVVLMAVVFIAVASLSGETDRQATAGRDAQP